jgi:2'-5' RNA ligase
MVPSLVSSCPDVSEADLTRIDSYALVAYIPSPLGEYLDRLRQEIVPGCRLRSHVSLLPPRPLSGLEESAWTQIRHLSASTPGFSIELGALENFPVSNVIYISLNSGPEHLRSIHDRLNQGPLAYCEPWPYHPHVTLGQDLPPESLAEARELAVRRWAEYPHARSFRVENITFVQNTVHNQWIDLAEYRLQAPARVG